MLHQNVLNTWIFIYLIPVTSGRYPLLLEASTNRYQCSSSSFVKHDNYKSGKNESTVIQFLLEGVQSEQIPYINKYARKSLRKYMYIILVIEWNTRLLR